MGQSPWGLEQKLHYVRAVYDFARDGGAVGDIEIAAGQIPANCLIVGGCIYVKTAVTSDGAATIAMRVESSEDILAETAKASFAANAVIAIKPDWATTPVRTTAKRGLTLTVGTAALTAGKLLVVLECLDIGGL